MKYALVTGATSGLGNEVAKALSKNGWFVFACGRNQGALDEFGSEYEYPIRMDVTDQKSIDEAYEAVSAKADHLDAIINFSGVSRFSFTIYFFPLCFSQVLHLCLLRILNAPLPYHKNFP